jgi:hypothetical protein
MRFGIFTIAAIDFHPACHALCNTNFLGALFPNCRMHTVVIANLACGSATLAEIKAWLLRSYAIFNC